MHGGIGMLLTIRYWVFMHMCCWCKLLDLPQLFPRKNYSEKTGIT